MTEDTPTVPAPASRNPEDHADALKHATDQQHATWAPRLRNLARCYLAYAAMIQRAHEEGRQQGAKQASEGDW